MATETRARLSPAQYTSISNSELVAHTIRLSESATELTGRTRRALMWVMGAFMVLWFSGDRLDVAESVSALAVPIILLGLIVSWLKFWRLDAQQVAAVSELEARGLETPEVTRAVLGPGNLRLRGWLFMSFTAVLLSVIAIVMVLGLVLVGDYSPDSPLIGFAFAAAVVLGLIALAWMLVIAVSYVRARPRGKLDDDAGAA